MDKDKALKNLIDARDVLNGFNLNYFLVDGTLLGCIREGDFIGHDTDLDIGVFMDEWTIKTLSRVMEKMMKKGFILYHSFGKFGECFEVAWRRDGIKLDFFFYHWQGDKAVFHAFLNGGRTLPDDIITYEYPSELINERKAHLFKGAEFVIPADPEKVLICKYGEDWRVPKTKWRWDFDPKNVVKFGDKKYERSTG